MDTTVRVTYTAITTYDLTAAQLAEMSGLDPLMLQMLIEAPEPERSFGLNELLLAEHDLGSTLMEESYKTDERKVEMVDMEDEWQLEVLTP